MERAPDGALQTSVSGLTISYERVGDGAPLVLLHPIGHASWVWEKLIPEIADQYDVITLDLPGFGGSERPSRQFGIQDFAEIVGAFIEKLGLAPANLGGSHVGALIALQLTVAAPQLVSKLVLIDCPGWNFAEGQHIWERFFIPRIETPADFQELATDRRVPLHPADELHERVRVERARSEGWATLCQEMATRYDVTERLHLVDRPTLLVYGEHSMLRRREQRMHDGIRGSRLAIICGTIASVPYEAPAELWAAMTTFLGSSLNG